MYFVDQCKCCHPNFGLFIALYQTLEGCFVDSILKLQKALTDIKTITKAEIMRNNLDF
jgi:hypothetical protein